jgi:hypothetical protein
MRHNRRVRLLFCSNLCSNPGADAEAANGAEGNADSTHYLATLLFQPDHLGRVGLDLVAVGAPIDARR